MAHSHNRLGAGLKRSVGSAGVWVSGLMMEAWPHRPHSELEVLLTLLRSRDASTSQTGSPAHSGHA